MAAFETMIAGVAGVERKGAAMPYVSVNGNMYASISKANVIGIRLSKTDLEEFLKTYDSGLYEGMPGHFMREYGAVPAPMLVDDKLLQSWFVKCHQNALTLKSKKTRR